MSPTTVVTTRKGAQYEFTADRLHVRQADEGWRTLDIEPSIERGFPMVQVFAGGGVRLTDHVADIAYV